jgi:hypothetical protein
MSLTPEQKRLLAEWMEGITDPEELAFLAALDELEQRFNAL